MAVFSRYARVSESDGSPMRVRTALALINQVLDEVLSEQEGDFDTDTRWCIGWFAENEWAAGEYGKAEQFANSRNTSMDGLERAGVIRKPAGKVWLIKPEDLPDGYDPERDDRPTVWEGTLYLSKLLEGRSVDASGQLLAKLGRRIDINAVKELSYLLYNICERKKWPASALRFNSLVTSWPDLTRIAQAVGSGGAVQAAFDFDSDGE